MDAYAVLGDRIDLIAETNALRPLVARLARPDWTAYLLLVDASQRLLEGRYDDALALVDRARDADPEGEAGFFQLVFASAAAMQTGQRAAGADRDGAEGCRRHAVPRGRLGLPDVQGR